MKLRAFLSILMIAGPASILEAQARTITVSTRPTCIHCTLQFQHLFDIGDDDGPGMVDIEDRVVRDSRGRFFVVSSYGTEVRVFDVSGTYLRTIGRKGGGPGEFQGISAVRITRGDTIRILDYTLSRLTVVGPQLDVRRSTPLGLVPQIRAVVLDDGSAVVNIDSRLPKLIGQPLHVLDTTGRVARSFGSDREPLRSNAPMSLDRVLSSRGGSELWVAHEKSYVIERWNAANATLLQRLDRVTSWFPNQQRQPAREWNALRDPPETRVVYLREDGRGRLWTTISVADRRWKGAVRAKERDHFEIINGREYTDLIVEVQDPRTATLVASMRFDALPYYFISDSLAAGFPQERNGKIVLPIYRSTMVDTTVRK